jgi:murein L,D-transpeptidase YafK
LLIHGFGYSASASGNSALYKGQSIPKNEKIDRIVIIKSRNELQAWSGKRLLKQYKVAIGSGGTGPKRYSGDKKTPEGTYRIDHRFASKTYHRFLHVTYPNINDRRAFKRGKAQGTIPKSASIGGAIGIHGEKKGFTWLPHKWMNWTRGCVALDNDEIEELYRFVVKNALVIIKP